MQIRRDDECYTGSGPASEVTDSASKQEVLIAIERVAEYEDVHPQMLAEDFIQFVGHGGEGWPWRIVEPAPGPAMRTDDECYTGNGPAREVVPQAARPGPDWSTLGPKLLEMLALAVRQIDGSTTADGRALQEVGWVRHARALITKAKESQS
jgi:hypothetical protein